jgi:hypothetical protein
MKTEWIEVSKRLPDNTKPVLVWDKDDYGIAHYDADGWGDYVNHLTKITHWMPIPEDPRAGY